MRVTDINSRDILLDEEKYEYVLICETSYKRFMGLMQLCIRFDEIEGFIEIYYGTRYLVLFGNSWYDKMYDRIKHLTSTKRLY